MLPLYCIDSFTSTSFKGNPAAVCILDEDDWPATEWLQQVAQELNLSETCFLLIGKSKNKDVVGIRWLTPVTEVPLCGHATLAGCYVLFNLAKDLPYYNTFQINLHAWKLGDTLVADKATCGVNAIMLSFPNNKPDLVCNNPSFETFPFTDIVKHCLGPDALDQISAIAYSVPTGKLLLQMKTNFKNFKCFKPNYQAMLSANNSHQLKLSEGTTIDALVKGVIVTMDNSILNYDVICADGESHILDVVSRYFAPWVGINEDPVTGAAHTVIGPYYKHFVLKQDSIFAGQYSMARDFGYLKVNVVDDSTVQLEGSARLVWEGQLHCKPSH